MESYKHLLSTYDVPGSFTSRGQLTDFGADSNSGCYLSISLQFYAPCLGITLCKYVNKAIRDAIVFMVYLRMPKLLSKKKKGKERNV